MSETLREHSNDVDDILSDTDGDIDNQIKELKTDYRDALTDKPEIAKYIERLRKITRKQQKKLNKFYKKLKDHKFVKKVDTAERETQTDDDPQFSRGSTAWGAKGEGSIAEEVKEVAESALNQTSFVYEPTSGMYYDYNSGYYYDAKLRMYYDGNTGNYMEYDYEKKEFKVYLSYESDNRSQSTKRRLNKRRKVSKRKLQRPYKTGKKPKHQKLIEAEEGEITESSESSSSENEDDTTPLLKDPGRDCTPCIRLIVAQTNLEKLKVGTLFLVTCTGGTLGREGDHAVLLPDIRVSKHHAKFYYEQSTSRYSIVDLGSRNGTWVDGERLSAALQESSNFEISHGTTIDVGCSKLLCHIHKGRDTCPECEPGVVQPVPSTSTQETVPSQPQYRTQLQQLKKRFGVEGAKFSPKFSKAYEDRAEKRRSTVGSSHSSEKTQCASLEEQIPQTNRGFKMLEKMGWSEGQGLGKDETGMAEPVPLISNPGTSGLGAGPSGADERVIGKLPNILAITKDRYRKLE